MSLLPSKNSPAPGGKGGDEGELAELGPGLSEAIHGEGGVGAGAPSRRPAPIYISGARRERRAGNTRVSSSLMAPGRQGGRIWGSRFRAQATATGLSPDDLSSTLANGLI